MTWVLRASSVRRSSVSHVATIIYTLAGLRQQADVPCPWVSAPASRMVSSDWKTAACPSDPPWKTVEGLMVLWSWTGRQHCVPEVTGVDSLSGCSSHWLHLESSGGAPWRRLLRRELVASPSGVRCSSAPRRAGGSGRRAQDLAVLPRVVLWPFGLCGAAKSAPQLRAQARGAHGLSTLCAAGAESGPGQIVAWFPAHVLKGEIRGLLSP